MQKVLRPPSGEALRGSSLPFPQAGLRGWPAGPPPSPAPRERGGPAAQPAQPRSLAAFSSHHEARFSSVSKRSRPGQGAGEFRHHPREPKDRRPDGLLLTLGQGDTKATSVKLSLSQRQGLPAFFPGRVCSELPLRATRAGTSEVLWEFSRAADWLPCRAVGAHVTEGPVPGCGRTSTELWVSHFCGKAKASYFNSNSP